MGNRKLKKRNETDPAFKWKIEEMYADDTAWNSDIDKVLSMAEGFDKYQGRLTENAKTLAAAFRDKDEIWQKLERAYVYAQMKLDEDRTLAASQARADKVSSVIAKVEASLSFFTPEVLGASSETLMKYVDEEPSLMQYRFIIKDLLRRKEHVLSDAEEKILAQINEVTDAPDSIFSMLNDADMKFGTVTDEDGDEVTLTHGNYISLMESGDRRVREDAYHNMYSSYKSLINTISTAYSYNVKTDVVGARIRKYDSARAAALFSGNISEEVYDNLIDVVHEYLPVMHRYMKLRKRILGVEELKMHDIYVPLVDIPKKTIPFEEAINIMEKALAPLGKEYTEQAVSGARSGWIDVYENEGKRSGAYSFGSYDSYPYILLNYSDTLKDVFTLVHEMGHSMHSYYTRKTQPFTYGSHSIFTAEVASTVNESLLMQYLIGNEADLQMKKYLINYHIEEFRTTLFRQTMFAEFEQLAHQHVAEGGSLTAEWLCGTYSRLNSLYHGPALTEDEYIKYEWARIPHFYRSFYVYQYATGYSAAAAISSKILNEGDTARDAYLKFLTTGDSDYPVELLRIAGVDMSRKEPVIAAMETFKNLVEELEELL